MATWDLDSLLQWYQKDMASSLTENQVQSFKDILVTCGIDNVASILKLNEKDFESLGILGKLFYKLVVDSLQTKRM